MARIEHSVVLCSLVLFAFLMSYSLFSVLLSLQPSSKQKLPPSPPHEDLLGDRPRLELRNSKTFKLAIFSDLHFGEDEHTLWGPEQDVNSTRVMRAVLDAESTPPSSLPDLVVLNGDLITGENTFRDNSTAYLHRVVAPMTELGLPWASTYGNHDSKFNLSRQMLYSAERDYQLSYTQRMEPTLPGTTNYYLLVHSPTTGRPAMVLWFFDSRGGTSYQNDQAGKDDIPDFVPQETANWFRLMSAAIRTAYGDLPSLAFVHIPPHVFLKAQEGGVDASIYPGINDDQPLAFQGETGDDEGFVDALVAEEGLHSVYVGHDHGNSWCSLWPSTQHGRKRKHRRHDGHQDDRLPILCFSKHTGYGGYGTWNRGARMVQVSFGGDGGPLDRHGSRPEMEVETWVRMENGEVVTHVMLNETYGVDRYPVANGE